MRDLDRALHALTVAEAAELLGLARIDHKLDHLTAAVEHIHRAVHRLEEQNVTTKEEILAELDAAKTDGAELRKDVARLVAANKDIADRLDQAVAANDLTAVGTAVADLRAAIQGADADVESASPEPTPPVEPATPAEPTA